MCAAMKSTAETSSGCSIQAFQISPVVTGTVVSRLTRWIMLDQVVDRLLAAEDGFVADDDAVDVAMPAGEIDDRARFRARCGLVFLSIQAPTVTRRPNSAAIAGHQFGAAGRRIGADRARVGREQLAGRRGSARRVARVPLSGCAEPSNGA